MKGILIAVVLTMFCLGGLAQTDSLLVQSEMANDSVFAAQSDSLFAITPDSVLLRDLAPVMPLDSADASNVETQTSNFKAQTANTKSPKRDWSSWRPDPQRALWLALVIPGGGQIYNRKYWKLPLVYGGFVGCAYALTWNNMMYKDYSQAYIDIMDDDPGTASYNQFMHLGRTINDQNLTHYQELFKKRRDRYRRYRDLSFFVLIGVYALSVIDAYVDAELSVFDISNDLSLKVEPAVISSPLSRNPLYASSVGLNCSLNF